MAEPTPNTHDNHSIPETLMKDYGTSLLRMCFLYLRDYQLAEDAVQETFLKAIRSLASFRGDSSPKTWLFRIAMRTCRDFRRTAWFRRVNPSDSIETYLPSTPAPDTQDDTVILAVALLPPKYKEVVLLRYYQDLPLTEIAAVLGMPLQTVASRLRRAKQKLRSTLEGWYFDESDV